MSTPFVRAKGRRFRLNRNAVDQALAGYLFILPALVSLIVFLIGPIIYAFVISFKHFSFLDPTNSSFVGFRNYVHLFQDPEFLRALWNTTLYSIIVDPRNWTPGRRIVGLH